MGADLDRTSACARTMLGIFEPECRVPGLRQSAATLLRQIALGRAYLDGSQPKPSPAASAASAGLARSTLRCKSQPTLWGHASRVPGRGWQGAVPPLTPNGNGTSWTLDAGGGLAPRPSCRCVLSRAPHEGHMAAGSCWGRLRGRGLGEAARGLVGQINGELAEDTRAKSALRTALQAHRGKLGNVDPKALAA